MFQEYINNLNQVERFDRICSTKDIKIGEVEEPGGAKRLALQEPGGDVLTLEDRAQNMLARQWSIPPDHFNRLPRDLQAAELTHFTKKQPKDITLRAVRGSRGWLSSGQSSGLGQVHTL